MILSKTSWCFRCHLKESLPRSEKLPPMGPGTLSDLFSWFFFHKSIGDLGGSFNNFLCSPGEILEFNDCAYFINCVAQPTISENLSKMVRQTELVYKWYVLPIGWLYITYHLWRAREPETWCFKKTWFLFGWSFSRKKERHFQELSEKVTLQGELRGDSLFFFLFGELTYPRWWFQAFFMFTPIWGNDPN